MHFSEGDIVVFAPGWCTEAEKEKLYRVLESYDDVQRAKIAPVDRSLTIIPVESVTYAQIVRADV